MYIESYIIGEIYKHMLIEKVNFFMHNNRKYLRFGTRSTLFIVNNLSSYVDEVFFHYGIFEKQNDERII